MSNKALNSQDQFTSITSCDCAPPMHGTRRRRTRFVCSVPAQKFWSATAKRTLDIVLAALLLLVLAPALLAVCVRWALCRTQEPIQLWGKTRREGLAGKSFYERQFHSDLAVRNAIVRKIPALWNVLVGDMSIVGPRPAIAGSFPLYPDRFNVRPGLVSLWLVRLHANIGWDGELQADRDYLQRWTAIGDIGILLRAAAVSLLRRPTQHFRGKLDIAGLPIDNLTASQAIQWIVDRLETGAPAQVSFINAHCVNVACSDPEYRNVLQQSALNLADGIGLRIAGQITGTAIRENVNGTDLFPMLCQALQQRRKSIFLLGGGPAIAAGVAEWVEAHYPGTRIAGYRNGFFETQQESQITREIKESGADLLLVAMGVPRQEVWIARHLEDCGVQVAIGVGGLFDFFSGRIPRAPMWMRELGLEWLFRFCQEPTRLFNRYLLGNWIFLWRVVTYVAMR